MPTSALKKKSSKNDSLDNNPDNRVIKLFRISIIAIPSVLLITTIFMSGVFLGKKGVIPLVDIRSEYMIGIYKGCSPFSLKPFHNINPVITAGIVNDVKAAFVADPFMIQKQGTWYLFFEVMKSPQNKGVIGLATSTNGQDWKYDRIVLEESFHLSYPIVFDFNGEILMMPECQYNYEISIYKADSFPYGWKKHNTLIQGNFIDPTIFNYGKHWYLFTSDRNDMLHLFWADNIVGPWNIHPKSPIVKFDSENARPCGRVIMIGDTIVRFTQNCKSLYGWDVRAFLINKLTPDTYEEQPYDGNPVLKGSGNISDWNGIRMHHIDLHQISANYWIAVVDGVGRWHEYGLGLFGNIGKKVIGPTFTFSSPYKK